MASDRDTPLVVVPFEEQRQRAIEHYDRITTTAGEWSSFVRDAILAYQPDAGALRAALRKTALELHLVMTRNDPLAPPFPFCPYPTCVEARAALASDTGGSSTAETSPK